MSDGKTWIVGLMALGFLAARAVADPTPEAVEFFEKKVRPVLVEHCFKCHSSDAKKPKGGLLLDSRERVLKGGDSGPAIRVGQPEKSKLVEAIGYKNVDLQMPPRAKLPDAVIADLTAWVKMGAPWGKDAGGVSGGKSVFDLAKRKQEHWAWQPLQPQKPPSVKNGGWPLSPVDQFVLARLEDKGLHPAPPADPRTLIRRLYFDLIGLPPTPAEVAQFVRDVGDAKPQAVERVVDRLLDAPQFGERWARHWLDLVRYAESRGHEFDYNLPNAFQYRDYVIRAFNRDVPYNQFVTEHIAGDLMPKPRMNPTEKFNESILGTGSWFLGEQVHSPVDICADRADRHDNMLDVMSKTFLGMTVACARCHDHKFDAISTKDYYALSGFLESSSYRLARFDSLDHNRGVAEALAKVGKQSKGPILKAAADCLVPAMNSVDQYLLGSREILVKTASRDEVIRSRKLDGDLLDRWVRHLPLAAKDNGDPLSAWARVTLDPAAADKNRLRDLVTTLIKTCKEKHFTDEKSWQAADVVIDYAKSSDRDWLQDGYVFGMSPSHPGDVILRGAPGQTQVTVSADRTSARTNAIWQSAKWSTEGDGESGSTNKQASAGRLIRSPSFRVKTDRVFCLVKGTGSVFACVEGHIMIAGPLHGNLVQSFKGGPGFHWISINLARYKGNRAHVEFTPAPGADFAVAMVVQADNPPDIQPEMREEILAAIAAGIDAGREPNEIFAEVAQIQRIELQAIVKDMRTANFGNDQGGSLAAWVVQHADLFADPKDFSRRLSDAAAPFLVEQQKLAAGIQSRSRLAPALLDGSAVDENVFLRGSYKTPGEVAPRRLLEALVGPENKMETPGSGRLQLAEQMTDPKITPLLPRVMVNRIWQHLFGQGIVASVDNFGVLGERPTHPELLDYLANRFVEDGWSLKKMIRLLVLSKTYQMSSRPDAVAQQADPRNLLLSHMRMRRLEGEAIRDAILQVSGSLDKTMYGRSVPVYLTQFQEGRGRPGSGPLDGNGRRSLYLGVRRNFLSSFLLAFDTPVPFSTVGRRTVSNVPAQALILLNDPFVHQQAGKWAKQIIGQEKTPRERVTAMYQAAFARPPSPFEMVACLEFLDRQGRLGEVGELALWSDLAHVLFNAKEFIYVN